MCPPRSPTWQEPDAPPLLWARPSLQVPEPPGLSLPRGEGLATAFKFFFFNKKVRSGQHSKGNKDIQYSFPALSPATPHPESSTRLFPRSSEQVLVWIYDPGIFYTEEWIARAVSPLLPMRQSLLEVALCGASLGFPGALQGFTVWLFQHVFTPAPSQPPQSHVLQGVSLTPCSFTCEYHQRINS